MSKQRMSKHVFEEYQFLKFPFREGLLVVEIKYQYQVLT